jgi:hypothetical protein
MSTTYPQGGGAFQPSADCSPTGTWDFTGATVKGVTTAGGSFSNATFSGTTTIGAGATLTSPTLVTPALGAATGTSVVLSGDCKAATYHVGATAGASGAGTTITAITVVNGIVTAITVS